MLESQVNTTADLQNFWLVGVTAILALGGLTSFVSWYRNEVRQAQENALRIEGTLLAFAGEPSSQSRDTKVFSTFIDESKTTIELVNAALAMSLEDSKRASQAVADRVTASRDDLNRQAGALVDQVAHRDDRDLVIDPVLRTQVVSLGERIANFTHMQILLPMQLPLGPVCSFVVGGARVLRRSFQECDRTLGAGARRPGRRYDTEEQSPVLARP